MIEKKHIEEIVNKAIEGTELFITSVSVKPNNKIMVFLDGDTGVSINDCVKVSRFVEKSLNRDNEDFELNVSSHGLSTPLLLPRQYMSKIGKSITVLMPDGEKIAGTLISANKTHSHLNQKLIKKNVNR